MTNDGNWKVQISLKANGHMLNIRGDSAMEVIAHITQFFRNDSSVADYVTATFLEHLDTASVDQRAQQRIVTELGATPITAPSVVIGQPTAQPQGTPPVGQAAPPCEVCGTMKIWKEGISQKSGKPYAFWACPNWKSHP